MLGCSLEGGSQRGRQPLEQPGLWIKLAPASSPAGNQYQAPALRTQQAAACPRSKGGGCSWLQRHHHPSPLKTLPCTPAGSQPCFTAQLEAKNSPGGAGREHGVQTSPWEPSCHPPHPSRGGAGTLSTHPWSKPAPKPSTPSLTPTNHGSAWLSPGTGVGDAGYRWEEAAPGQTPISQVCV